MRDWIVRKLLNLANRLSQDRLVCDAINGWRFERQWVQPVLGGSRGDK